MIAPPRNTNSLQKIMKLKPRINSEWNVLAYVLNRDMINEKGELDDLHAVVFSLGSFDNYSKAETYAKEVIEETGHSGIIVAPFGAPIKLTTKPENMVDIPVNPSGKIIELESKEYKLQKENYEKRLKLEKDLLEESNQETNPDSIEYLKRQCYLAIKNKSSYEKSKFQYEEALNNYNKRIKNIREHINKYPEHEKDWLPFLRDKLVERGESELFNYIEKGYELIKSDIFN